MKIDIKSSVQMKKVLCEMGLSFLSEIGNTLFTFSASVNTYHLNCQQLAKSGFDFRH